MNQPEPDLQNTLDVFQTLHNGTLLRDIAVNIQEAALKTRELRKQTEVSIKLVFTPAAQGDISPVLVKGQTTLKVPPIERGATILFTTEEGRLSRNDPRQADFFAAPLQALEDVRPAPEPAPLARAVGDDPRSRVTVIPPPPKLSVDTETGEIQ